MRFLLIVIGFISLALAIIGLLVPLLPTTPFLLLSSACFLRSSETLYKWLINHKIFGRYLWLYLKYHAVPLHTKIIALCMLWLSIGYSVFYVAEMSWHRVFLLIIAVCVTVHILRLNSATKEMAKPGEIKS